MPDNTNNMTNNNKNMNLRNIVGIIVAIILLIFLICDVSFLIINNLGNDYKANLSLAGFIIFAVSIAGGFALRLNISTEQKISWTPILNTGQIIGYILYGSIGLIIQMILAIILQFNNALYFISPIVFIIGIVNIIMFIIDYINSSNSKLNNDKMGDMLNRVESNRS